MENDPSQYHIRAIQRITPTTLFMFSFFFLFCYSPFSFSLKNRFFINCCSEVRMKKKFIFSSSLTNNVFFYCHKVYKRRQQYGTIIGIFDEVFFYLLSNFYKLLEIRDI